MLPILYAQCFNTYIHIKHSSCFSLRPKLFFDNGRMLRLSFIKIKCNIRKTRYPTYKQSKGHINIQFCILETYGQMVSETSRALLPLSST